MKFQDVARFEFRHFGSDLTRFGDAFAGLGRGIAQSPSRETYIATRLNIEANVKIRAHGLEVKGLEGRLHSLEQWRPVLLAPFPVAAAEIENTMAPALGIDLELGDALPMSEPALLQLVAAQPALATVVVEKARTLFDLADCEAEFCALRIGDERLHTVAVEAVEAAAARRLLQRTGLDGLANESYPAFLSKRLFGSALVQGQRGPT